MSLFDRFRSTPPTRQEYFAIFLKALAHRGVTPTVAEEERFFLRLPTGKVYLDNGFSEYTKARPAERPNILDRYIAGALAVHETKIAYADAELLLLPVLRADTYASLIALNTHASDKGSKERTATIPFASGLVLCIVRDTPETMMFVNQSTLNEWQVTEDQALQRSLVNLRENTDGPEFEQPAPGLYKAIWKDGYGTSRVALPDLFRDLELDGDPVFFSPTRDLLWVTGHRDSFNQAYMLKLGGDAHFDSYPLSPNLYRLEEEGWVLFRPKDTGVAQTLEGLQQRRANLDYRQQKETLDGIFERDGVDIFVASHNLYEGSDGQLFSMAVWTQGVDSLLPLTDRIILFIDGEPGERLTLPWQIAVDHLTEMIELDPTYLPARYRVRQFPTRAQWVELERRIAQAEPLQ